MKHNEIAGYILSGGKNRRMKGNKKIFLDYQGKTFLQWILEAMVELPKVYLSVDSKEAYEHTGLPLVEDQYPAVGPMGGLCSGLLSCKEEALFVTACDTPFLTKKVVNALVCAYQNTRTTVILMAGGRLQPLLGVYPKETLPVFLDRIENCDYKMKNVLDRIDYSVIELELLDRDSLAAVNINSLQDYEDLIRNQ